VAVAAGTALSRVIAGAHFYSDAIFGAALGWTLSWFTMALLDRWYNGPIRTEIPADTPRQT
jgi:membrane-associated phospholipid phosphatase